VNFVGKKLIYHFAVLFVTEISALNIDFQKTIHVQMLLEEHLLDSGPLKSVNSNPKNALHFQEKHHNLVLLSAQSVAQNEQ